MLVSEAVREVRRHLGGDKAARNKVNGAVTSSATSVVLTYAANLSQGSIIETPAGELLYVWDYTAATKTATVERGHDGTTAAAIDDGAIVRVNVRYPEHEILAALNDEVRALSAEGLYQEKSATLTWDTATQTFDTTAVTDMLAPYALMYEPTNGDPVYEFSYQRRDTYIRPYLDPLSTTATLWYRAPFVVFTATTDDLETVCKIPEEAHDILPLGAAARLLMGKEAQRLDTAAQTHARKTEDVPATSNAQLARLLKMQRDSRLAHEVRRLRAKWPIRR